ncbi:major royal jelly protein 9-like [Ptiloglossa arizonensis]|uniref:major royal jelly protein 9-like n=1 Tax=Ptiloglossa arizonensis TaxID=3350558 RepID=UPI003F9F6B85
MLAPWILAFSFVAIFLNDKTEVASLKVVNHRLQTRWAWKYFDFLFESDSQRKEAIESDEYNRSNCFPIDVDQWNDKTFVTIIRDKGVPSSLNTISYQKGDGGPLLQPYPDWSWTKTDCSGITSVYRVAIDRCSRLWVLDTGVSGTTSVCLPQLLSFDLKTSKLLKRVTIPKDVAVNTTTGEGLLVTPIVQTSGYNCESTNVYMADVEGYAILVYNGDSIKRVTSSALVYDPHLVTYTIEGESFMLEDGPVGMALSPVTNKLYLSPMSSLNMVSTDTYNLSHSQNNNVEFQVYENVLPTQSSAKAMSRNGILFMGLVNNTAIACWNEKKPLEENNMVVIAQNSSTLQFTSGMKIKNRRTWFGIREDLVVLTNRYQKIASDTLNFNEVNFRILQGDVRYLVQGTCCDQY